MRTLFISMLFAVPLVSNAAEPPLQTSALVFSQVSDIQPPDWEPHPVALQILSETFASTTVTTESWEKPLSVVGSDGGMQGDYSLSMNLKPKKGFRITGFSFSADVEAAFGFQQIPPHHADHVIHFVPPTVGNAASIHLPGSTEDDVLKSHVFDASGTSPFSFARHDLSIVDATTLEFFTSVQAYAFDGWYFVPGMETENEGRLGAYASMSLTNPRLTIYTALLPVPEPATWAMLLAGIGMVGLARRRRRH